MARKAGGGVNVIITGIKELDARLKTLPTRIRNKHVRKCMRKGLKVIQDAAKSYAPVDTGALKKAIKVRAGKQKKGDIVVEVRVGEGDFKGKTFYGAFQEYGTKHM